MASRKSAGGAPRSRLLPEVGRAPLSPRSLPKKEQGLDCLPPIVSMLKRPASTRGRSTSVVSRPGRLGGMNSSTASHRNSAWGLGSRRSTFHFSGERIAYSAGNRGAVSRRASVVASNQRLQRVSVDVAVVRLQRWLRATVLRRLVNSSGALASRFQLRISLEHRLWKLRTRIAKRIIIEACSTFARSSIQRERDEVRITVGDVTVVAAFLRAVKSLRLKLQKHRKVSQQAATVIQLLWRRCKVRSKSLQTSRERKLIRLLMDEESIERRELVRQRLLFVIECHQSCYNDALLLGSGLFARRLHVSENLFTSNLTDKEKSCCGTPAVLEEVPVDARNSRPTLSHSMSFWTHSSHGSSVLKSFPNLSAGPHPEGSEKGKDEKGSAWVNLAETDNGDHSPYRTRANACFVTAILLEEGHLMFPASMGACQPGMDPKPDLARGSAPVYCRARIQDTVNALKKVEVRVVREGSLFLREPLHSLSIFKEFCMFTKSREGVNPKEQTKAFILGPNATPDNYHFLYPDARRTKKRRELKPLSHLSVTSDAMGEEWSRLLYATWAGDGVSRPPSRSFAHLSLAKPESPTRYHRIPFQQTIHDDPTHPLHDLLKSIKRKEVSTTANWMSTSFYDEEPPTDQWANDPYVDHEKIRYEIERLLIQEYRRRKCIEEARNSCVRTIESTVERDRGVIIPTTRRIPSAAFNRGMSKTFLRLLRESGRA